MLSDVGTWTVKADIPTSRVLHGACVVGGKIYVFGGQQLGGGAGIASVEEYDPQEDTWRTRSDMPTPRLGMTVSAVGNRCYLIGGAAAPGRAGLALVEEYDPATDSWRRRADMPAGRAAAASTVIDGKIYVAGGLEFGDIQSAAVAALNVYDPVDDGWSVGAAMPLARAFLAASSLEGTLYVFGGGSSVLGTLDSSVVQGYDPLTDSWFRLADLGTPRGGLVASEVGGRLLVIGGGFDAGRQSSLEEYHPGSDTWTRGADMPTARWGATGKVVNGTVFVLGGSSEWGFGHNSLSTNEAYEAVAFRINSGLNDAWFNPATAGQGLLISVFPGIQQMFVAWFTYDAERPPENVEAILGEPGHRWLTAQGPYNGDTATLNLFLTKGGVFDAAEPPVTTDPNGVGTLTIEFADCNAALVTYDLIPSGLSGEFPIERIVLDNVALCEAEMNP